jgi:hypothetical protein
MAIGSDPLYPVETSLGGVRFLELGPELSLELLYSWNIGAILVDVKEFDVNVMVTKVEAFYADFQAQKAQEYCNKRLYDMNNEVKALKSLRYCWRE